jgi:hypothetical protein
VVFNVFVLVILVTVNFGAKVVAPPDKIAVIISTLAPINELAADPPAKLVTSVH